MRIISSPEKLQAAVKALKARGKTIGLVPTMGALHEGHLSLVKKALAENGVVVVSIFVNPAQFGPNEDYLRYPRPFNKDKNLCLKAGVDIIFAPRPESMYPEGYQTYIKVENISDILCGRSRPGHFRGVATVVAKLFNASLADRAYFGAKDYQQLKVLERMAGDLNFPVKLVACPIVREPSGLALSSRNTYLNPEQKAAAAGIRQALQQASYMVKCQKSKNSGKIVKKVKEIVRRIPGSRIDYIELRDAGTLAPVKAVKGRCVILAAVWVGKTRLIDNIVI